MKTIIHFFKLLIVTVCFFSINNTEVWAQLNSINNEKIQFHCNESYRGNKTLALERAKEIQGMGKVRSANFNLPVQIHVVRNSNGTGGITQAEANNELALANAAYSNLSVEFFQCSPVHFIDSNYFYNHIYSDATGDHVFACGTNNYEYNLCTINNVADVINIYYVTTNGLNWSAFPDERFSNCHDWIIMNRNSLGFPGLLAHELGHYFDLLHTHETVFGIENITRNTANSCYNADVAGDLCPDTDADRNQWDSCSVVLGPVDLCANSAYGPDAYNLMCYSDCNINISSDQASRIYYSILSPLSRGYLTCSGLSACQSNWNLTGNVTTSYYWQANDHILSIAKISNAKVTYDAGSYIDLKTGFNSYISADFTARIEGCWGEYNYKSNFENPNENTEPEEFSETNVYPNPVADDLTISSNFDLSNSVIKIFNSLGQIVFQSIQNDLTKNYSLKLNLEKIPSGVYFIQLSGSDFFVNKQFIKQ